MSERYTKASVRNVWESRFLPAAMEMGFDVSEWRMEVGSPYTHYKIVCPIPVAHYSTVGTGYGLDSIGKTAREAYHTLVNMACAWEAVARVKREQARESAKREGHDMTCGECGRTWNSTVTFTPSARCPFEYDHAEG